MNNFGTYLTAEEAYNLDQAMEGGRRESLSYYQELARREARTCMNCTEEVWRYADADLCFSHVTGEADAYDDYEISA